MSTNTHQENLLGRAGLKSMRRSIEGLIRNLGFRKQFISFKPIQNKRTKVPTTSINTHKKKIKFFI